VHDFSLAVGKAGPARDYRRITAHLNRSRHKKKAA
jgi:hypothetical protein